MSTGINAINEAVKEASAFTHPLFNELGKVIVGQQYLTERLSSACWPTATSSSKACRAWPKRSP